MNFNDKTLKNIFVFFLLATFIIITPTFSQPCIDCRIGILATPYFHDVVAEGYILLRTIDTMFCDFVVDTSIESMSYGSCNVYIIPTQYNRYLPESLDSFSLPDSVRLDLINWTYDGGKLVIMGENCLARGGGAVVTDLLHDSRWNTGMRYDSTRVVPEYPDPAYEEFAIHPILAGLPDTVWADRAGNVIVTPPAIRLVWTENPEYRAIHCYDTTIYRSNPTMIAMSHWGEGTVIYHTDLSNFDSYYNYYVSGITFRLFDCNYTPTFNNSPAIGFLINCFNDTLSIEVYISNFGIIDPDSLSIKWEESFYTHSSELLEIRDTSFVFRVPPGIYHDGDTLSICIDKLVDTEGYWRYDSICWDYYIDIDEYPPELSGFVPPIGETVEMLDTISLIATDPSGINTTTVQFHFADSLFTLNDSCVRFLGDTIYFNLRCAGFDPCLGDTCVEICLSLQDDNKDCTPTAVETCWVVYSEVDDTPPFLSGFYPEINDTILILDIIHLIAVDSSGIDFSSIEFSFMDSIIMWGDSCIWLIGDTIYFDPICAGLNPGWVDTTLTVCVYLQDNVVECSPNAIDTCWSFYLNSSGIDEVQLPTDFEIKAYPNPFNSRCYLSGPDGLKADIFDVSGRFIKSIKLPGFWCGENEKGEKVGSGIYFLRVEGCKPGISRVLLLK